MFFFFQAEDGIRDGHVTGVQTCALPISSQNGQSRPGSPGSPGGLTGHAHTFAERLRLEGATVLATFTGADLDGCPAALRAPEANLFHLGCAVEEETMTAWIDLLTGAASLSPPQLPVPPTVLERSEEHTSELQSRGHLVCRLLLE